MSGYQYAIDLEQYVRDEAKYFCDMMKISQTVFSRKLPSERYNGIVNLYYIVYNPNATREEIDIAMVIFIWYFRCICSNRKSF